MKKLVSLLMFCLVFPTYGQTGDDAALRERWTRMNATKKEALQEFRDAKYGMFIHWGLYSIPGGVWKGVSVDDAEGNSKLAEWIQYILKIPRADYEALAAQFDPRPDAAENIVKLAKASGMKYLVITAKHHDGFALFDSKYSRYDIMDASPHKQDIIEAFYNACKKYGIDFGIYYSHNIDWADGADCGAYDMKARNDAVGKKTKLYGLNDWDPSPNTFEEYLEQKAYPQVGELLEKFPDTKQIWYDMAYYLTAPQSFKFYDTVYKAQPRILVNSRIGHNFGDFDIPGDNQIPSGDEDMPKPWQTVGTTNNSWGYKSYDQDWKTPEELLFWLVEIVSKGGNYMLNVGPTASGEIPEQSVRNLQAVGKWLDVNGEAIYGTTRWTRHHEGPTKIEMAGTENREKHGFTTRFTPQDFWFTAKGDKVYVISLNNSERNILINSLASETGNVKDVKLLGTQTRLRWKQTDTGLQVRLPEQLPSEMGHTLAVQINQEDNLH